MRWETQFVALAKRLGVNVHYKDSAELEDVYVPLSITTSDLKVRRSTSGTAPTRASLRGSSKRTVTPLWLSLKPRGLAKVLLPSKVRICSCKSSYSQALIPFNGFMLWKCGCTLGEGRTPDWDIDLSKISSLLTVSLQCIKPPIVRPPMSPVPMYHGMFRCMSRYCYSNVC